jgi:hypothetical protein
MDPLLLRLWEAPEQLPGVNEEQEPGYYTSVRS